jgi:hypothetical protein
MNIKKNGVLSFFIIFSIFSYQLIASAYDIGNGKNDFIQLSISSQDTVVAYKQQVTSSNYTQDEIRKANDLGTDLNTYLQQNQPVVGGSDFVRDNVREANRVAGEVERANDELMKKARQEKSSPATGSNLLLILLGAGLAVGAGVFWLLTIR